MEGAECVYMEGVECVCIWKGGVCVHWEREGVNMEGGGVCMHGEREGVYMKGWSVRAW